MPPDIRDEVVDKVRDLAENTELPIEFFLKYIDISKSKFYSWNERYGKDNSHNGSIPRDFWLEDSEREAIIKFHSQHPLNGYRRLAFMMLDANLVCASPSTVYRVLKDAGVIDKFSGKSSKKGTGFEQPLMPHEHWHIDVTYINIQGTFYYLAAILDGCSRYIVHWEIRESMKENEIELIVERAREKFPGVNPRVISDNGPQFISKDFKTYVRLCGMTHVRTSPYYPQSNGKLERWNKTLKIECIRPMAPGTCDIAKKVVQQFVDEYNNARLHSGIGYIAPKDKLEGRDADIFRLRDERLENARAARKMRSQKVA